MKKLILALLVMSFVSLNVYTADEVRPDEAQKSDCKFAAQKNRSEKEYVPASEPKDEKLYEPSKEGIRKI